MNINELFEAVKEWGSERGINDPKAQMCKLIEELGEMNRELTRGRYNSEAMQDAIGDVLVVLVIEANILGLDPIECLNRAYNEIKDRRGKNIDGSFVKEI